MSDITETDGLRVERRGALHLLTLARPDKMNALSAGLVEALIAAVDRAQAEQARAIVFQGEGRNFSAGFDFGDWESQSEGDLLLRFVRIEMLLQRVAATPCLTVALAHGRNFGAGVDLFGACKWRLAAPEASFRMPGLKFGLVLGTRRFAALVGASARAPSWNRPRPSTPKRLCATASSAGWRSKTNGRRRPMRRWPSRPR